MIRAKRGPPFADDGWQDSLPVVERNGTFRLIRPEQFGVDEHAKAAPALRIKGPAAWPRNSPMFPARDYDIDILKETEGAVTGMKCRWMVGASQELYTVTLACHRADVLLIPASVPLRQCCHGPRRFPVLFKLRARMPGVTRPCQGASVSPLGGRTKRHRSACR